MLVFYSIRSLLNPELTASWEKGLNYVAEGSVTEEEYMQKLEHFVRSRTDGVLGLNNQYALRPFFDEAAKYYKAPKAAGTTGEFEPQGAKHRVYHRIRRDQPWEHVKNQAISTI